jgi:hypothetical protein
MVDALASLSDEGRCVATIIPGRRVAAVDPEVSE